MDVGPALIAGLSGVLKGKEPFLTNLVVALLAGGHVLIEDAPGLGKTTVAKALAGLIGESRFTRIQFTPDLLPYDITGVDVFDPHTNEFVFKPGPVFGNVVLADEINRATPKVQSALLEVMAENQVTVGNTTHPMGRLFFVVGTQNPIEIEGTYPLPIAQIDRFMMRLEIGYPDEAHEREIVTGDPSHRVLPYLTPVCSLAQVAELHGRVQGVHCDRRLVDAVVRMARATREHSAVDHGASPRGALMLVAAARARALLSGRDYCTDDDLLDLAVPVLAHRLLMRDHGVSPEELVGSLAADALRDVPR